MPNCKKCDNYFPYNIKIDGKERNLGKRKYCFDCSPFNKHNTRILGTDGITNKRKCLLCEKNFEYDRSKGNKGSECNSCRVNKRRFKIKSELVEYKGGKCIACGYNKSNSALTFHHVNPKEKEFTIGGKHCLSIDKLKMEVDKCVLLCHNCHAEHHEGLSVIDYSLYL